MDWRDLVLPCGLVTISPYSLGSIGAVTGNLSSAPASGTWDSANRAVFVPFRVSRPIYVVNMFVFNGLVVSGNLDIGIYTSDGTRLVSIGSTAQAGTSAIQTLDITDTLLGPGLFYMALVFNNTTARVFQQTVVPSGIVCGMAIMNAAFPLPATATFSQSYNYLPVFGLTTRSVV
jgi:hypothetical protein